MSASSIAGVRVLVVDDDEGVREAVAEYLLDCGADVVAVESAEAAVRVMCQGRPDVLVSDVSMPEHDGFWLIRAVRTLPIARGGDVPAIAVTGRLDLEAPLLRAGFTDVRVKPLGFAELAELIAGLAARC